VASNEDNEENKQGDLNFAHNPEKAMEQIEEKDDHKIAAVAGKGGAPLIYEEDKWAPEMIQPNLAQEAAA
jgi:hypothetical protein